MIQISESAYSSCEDEDEKILLAKCIHVANLLLQKSIMADSFIELINKVITSGKYDKSNYRAAKAIKRVNDDTFFPADSMAKLRIRFEEQDTHDVYVDDEDSNLISINKLFYTRYSRASCAIEEKTRIIFVVSVCILHQLAHLNYQWRGFDTTPDPFQEAGEYIENSVFGGVVRLLLRKSNGNKGKKWNANMPIVGVMAHYTKLEVLDDDAIKMLVEAKDSSSISLPLSRRAYTRKEGEFAHHRVSDEYPTTFNGIRLRKGICLHKPKCGLAYEKQERLKRKQKLLIRKSKRLMEKQKTETKKKSKRKWDRELEKQIPEVKEVVTRNRKRLKT